MTTKANERLMIVRLNLSQWTPRKYDRQASDDVARLHGAASAKEVGRFNKILIDLDSIRELQQRYGHLRLDHYAMTAPWADDGIRVLPAELYFDYCTMVRVAIEEIEDLKEAFFREYPKLVDDAKVTLKSLFNQGDYPSLMDLKSKFAVTYHFEPLPNPEDVRVWGIGDEAAKEIANDIRATIEESVRVAQRSVVDRVVERAKEFIEKVQKYHEGEKKKIPRNRLYESAIENLRDVVSLVIDGLNVTNDPELSRFAKDLDGLLRGTHVEDLKDKPKLREQKIAEVEATLKKFAGIFN